MKKYIPTLVLTALIVPSVAFASWWNPATWFNNWSSSGNSNASTTALEQKITELENKVNSLTSTTTLATSTPVVIVATTTPATTTPILVKKINKVTPVISYPTSTQSAPAPTPTPIATPATTCPAGYTCTSTSAAREVQQPVILSSTSDGVISGQGFTGVDSVYIVPINTSSQIDLPFNLVSDTEVIIQSIPSSVSAGQYNLYVANSTGGISAPFLTHLDAPQTAQQPILNNSYDQLQVEESQKQNSAECQTATSNYNAIETQIKPLQDQQNAYSNNFDMTGKYQSLSLDQEEQLTNLTLRESDLFNKKLDACEIFTPTPPPVYNTDCQIYGDSANCTTY